MLLGAWLFASMITHGRGRCERRGTRRDAEWRGTRRDAEERRETRRKDLILLRVSPRSSPSSPYNRMCALAEVYQGERPNVETSDLTALIVRALALIVGKMAKDERE